MTTSDSLIPIIEAALREGSKLYSAQDNSWENCAKHIYEAIQQTGHVCLQPSEDSNKLNSLIENLKAEADEAERKFQGGELFGLRKAIAIVRQHEATQADAGSGNATDESRLLCGASPLNPDMPAQELRLHMGELSAQEMRTARAAIRWANTKFTNMVSIEIPAITTPEREDVLHGTDEKRCDDSSLPHDGGDDVVKVETQQPVDSASDGLILPERDQTKPAEQQGVFRKFTVRRVDGSDALGGKHHGCEYFVLDVDHDAHAKAALAAYAESCKDTHPELSRDMAVRYRLEGVPERESVNLAVAANAILNCKTPVPLIRALRVYVNDLTDKHSPFDKNGEYLRDLAGWIACVAMRIETLSESSVREGQ